MGVVQRPNLCAEVTPDAELIMSVHRTTGATLLFLLGGLWGCAGTARPVTVHPGARVRITAPALAMEHEVGEIAALTRDSLVLTAVSGGNYRLPLHLLERVEVSGGEERSHRKGAVLGAVIGGVIGGIAGAASHEPCDPDTFCLDIGGAGLAATGGALFGGLGGGLAGALIGTAFREERWERATLRVAPGSSPVVGGESSAWSLSLSVPVGGR